MSRKKHAGRKILGKPLSSFSEGSHASPAASATSPEHPLKREASTSSKAESATSSAANFHFPFHFPFKREAVPSPEAARLGAHDGVRRDSAAEDNWMSVFEGGGSVASENSNAPRQGRPELAPATNRSEERRGSNSSISMREGRGWVAGDLVMAGGRVVPVVAGQRIPGDVFFNTPASKTGLF